MQAFPKVRKVTARLTHKGQVFFLPARKCDITTCAKFHYYIIDAAVKIKDNTTLCGC